MNTCSICGATLPDGGIQCSSCPQADSKSGKTRGQALPRLAIAISLLLGVGVHMLARSPRPRTAAGDDLRGTFLAISMFALGVGVLIFIISRAPVVRKQGWFCHAALVGWCGALIGIGALTGLWLRWGDHDLSFSRAEDVRKALLSYRSKEGRFPQSLTSLVPGYLAELPKARAGIFAQDFEYRPGEGKEGGFILQFHDSLGVTVLEPQEAYLTVPRD